MRSLHSPVSHDECPGVDAGAPTSRVAQAHVGWGLCPHRPRGLWPPEGEGREWRGQRPGRERIWVQVGRVQGWGFLPREAGDGLRRLAADYRLGEWEAHLGHCSDSKGHRCARQTRKTRGKFAAPKIKFLNVQIILQLEQR